MKISTNDALLRVIFVRIFETLSLAFAVQDAEPDRNSNITYLLCVPDICSNNRVGV